MEHAYKTDTFEQHGTAYRVDWFYDCALGAPWEERDGHGVVSEWTTRDKKPSERLLNQDGRSKRFYDVAASQRIALAEGWDAYPYGEGTKRQQAARAVEADFERLRSWCADEWGWCGLVVTERRVDADGFEYDGEASGLWGIESDADGYFPSVIQDLIGDIEFANNHRHSAA